MSRLFAVTTTLYLARFDAEVEIVAQACPGRVAPPCSNPSSPLFADSGDAAEVELEHVWLTCCLACAGSGLRADGDCAEDECQECKGTGNGTERMDVVTTLTDVEREACETACVRRAEALSEPPEPDDDEPRGFCEDYL